MTEVYGGDSQSADSRWPGQPPGTRALASPEANVAADHGLPLAYSPPPDYSPPGWPAAATLSGGIPLRPLSLGEIFNGAITSMRRSPAATLGAAALLSVAVSLATALSTLELNHLRGTGRVPSPAAGGWIDGLSLVIGFASNVLLLGLVTVVVSRSVRGVTTSLSELWQLARPRLPALLGTTGLLLLIYCALWIPFVLVLAVGAGQPFVILLLLLIGLATVLAEVAGWTLLSMAAVVVVLERTGPATALRRSWQIVRTSFWRILGILLLTSLIYFVASEVLALPFLGAQLAVVGGAGRFHVSLLSVTLAGLGGIIAGTITRPFLAGATVLLYCDTRMRREGLDLVLHSGAGPLLAGDAESIWRPAGPDSAAQTRPRPAAW
jgi:hypothetical protein